MSFFGSDFFKEPHFKAPFYGEAFFQEPYFNDTTIAHGLAGGTGDPSLVTIACSRTITGTMEATDAILLINGTPATVNTVSSVEKDLNIAISDTIVGDDVLVLTFNIADTNNVGALDNFSVTNNEIVVAAFETMNVQALRAYARDLGIDIHGINGKDNLIAAIRAWHEG